MPAIGPSSRRAFLALAAAAGQAVLHAEDASTLALLTKLAARLSDNNSAGAVDLFAKTMPAYGEISQNLDALTSQYDIICVIEIREESGDAAHRKADTEWFLQFKSKQENGPTERRNTKVQVATELLNGRWRITALEPRSLLTPPQIR